MDQTERLKLVMLKISKMTWIPYTSNVYEFSVQMHQLGFLTDEEMNQIEQIGLQL